MFTVSLKCFSSSTAAQPVHAAADGAAVAPGAEAAPGPGATATTADPGPAPTPDPGRGPGPSLSPSPEPPGEASRSLPPGHGPAPGPSRGVEPHNPTEDPNPGPGPNPRVGLNPQRTTEQSVNPNLDTIWRYSRERVDYVIYFKYYVWDGSLSSLGLVFCSFVATFQSFALKQQTLQNPEIVLEIKITFGRMLFNFCVCFTLPTFMAKLKHTQATADLGWCGLFLS